MLSPISQVNINKIELLPSFKGENNTETRQPVEQQNSKSWILWTGLAALGAVGIYLATRGKGGVKTVEEVAQKTSSNVENVGKVPNQTPNKALDKVPSQKPNKVPEKASADGVVYLTGDDAINKLNEAYKAGKTNMYAYIPKNRTDCVVVVERNSNGTHYLSSSRVFDRKTFKYGVSSKCIADDIKPISSKNFSRWLFNNKVGSAKIISENGTEISINNSMGHGCSGIEKDLNIIKDESSYKKSKYIREKDNAKVCMEELTVQDYYAGFKNSVNGTVENVSDNFDTHKKEFFEKLRKKQ